MNFFLFQIFPYIAIFTCIIGCVLRFDRDPYSWRTKSSQLLRRRQLIAGSVLFHVGILIVLAGHAVGLLTPIWVFDMAGISHSFKQLMAMSVGGFAGVMCLFGLLLLLHRRLFDDRIRATGSRADILVLVLILAQLLLGLSTISVSMQHLDGLEMVKFMSWAQYIVTFQEGAYDFVADAALVFKLHLTLGMFLIMLLPFTRLVHLFSAPIGYAFRKHYQIVRRREV